MSALPLIFGYSIIAVGLIIGAWLFTVKRLKATQVVAFCTVFGALGFACSYLPYLARVEAGPLKLIMWENAPQLLALEKRVASLDEEVASKERQLSELLQRSEKLKVDNEAAQNAILRLNQQSELYDLYLDAWLRGKRSALDRLEELSNEKGYLEADAAREYWKHVVDRESTADDVTDTSWSKEAQTQSVTQLMERCNTPSTDIMKAFEKCGIIDAIRKRTDMTKKEKLAFFSAVLEKEEHIRVSAQAGRAFNEIAGLGFPPLARKDILQWWRENAEKVK